MRGGEHTKDDGEGKRIVGGCGENRVPDLADGGRGRDAVARWRATVTGLHSTCRTGDRSPAPQQHRDLASL